LAFDCTNNLFCVKASWHGRKAYEIGNNIVRLTVLTGGGHVVEFRFMESTGFSTINPMWVPPWRTIEPYNFRSKLHAGRYGPLATGKLLSGLAGHNICLDYFGVPSEKEAEQGLSMLGEAPSTKWRESGLHLSRREIALTLSVDLPLAGLKFSREIKLRRNEGVAYFKEIVTNLKKTDHFFHWVQHVTLGAPFLSQRSSYVAGSVTKGLTYPHGYDGKGLLASSHEFEWPFAPGIAGGAVDLRVPFTQRGSGFVTAALFDTTRTVEFVAAVNSEHRVMLGYCFSRSDYPWLALWEENQARTENPWHGKCQARGLEFGSTPFPFSRREIFALGTLFGTPTFVHVPARSQKTIHYLGFLESLPPDFGTLRDIKLGTKVITLLGSERGSLVRVAASGVPCDPGLVTGQPS
jgi:hypothetical protein